MKQAQMGNNASLVSACIYFGGRHVRYAKGQMEKQMKRESRENGEIIRPNTRLPKSRAGGQGPYLRSPDHLGRSSEVKKEIKS